MPRSSIRTAGRAEPTLADPSPQQPAPSPDGHEGAGEAPRWSGLEHLYRRHAGWLLTALRGRFGREAAEDLSQETFWRARGYAEADVDHPRGLLLSIATNVARETRRREGVRAPDARRGVEVADGAHWSPGDQDTRLLLKQIVIGLPPKLREVFILSRFEGLTYPEIAQRCGISIKTVEWRMSRALDICSARLRD